MSLSEYFVVLVSCLLLFVPRWLGVASSNSGSLYRGSAETRKDAATVRCVISLKREIERKKFMQGRERGKDIQCNKKVNVYTGYTI